jgi:hypothetical protein
MVLCGDAVTVYYPRKKTTRFDKEIIIAVEGRVYSIPPGEVPCERDWHGMLESKSPSLTVDISYGDKKLKKLVVEDWNSEPLHEREFSLHIEINERFHIRPLFNLPVSDDGYGEEGEFHYFLEPVHIPIVGPALPPSGEGLFERGLAVPGIVNPGTVRYSVQCENCFEGFTFRSHHAGMSDMEYFYCDKSSQPLTISAYDRLMNFKRPGVGSKPDEFTPAEIADARRSIETIEKLLPRSDFGGRFRWLAPFRCPHCSHPLIDFRNNLFRKAWEYYVCCHRGHVMKSFSSDMLEKEKDEAAKKAKDSGAGGES